MYVEAVLLFLVCRLEVLVDSIIGVIAAAWESMTMVQCPDFTPFKYRRQLVTILKNVLVDRRRQAGGAGVIAGRFIAAIVVLMVIQLN